MDVAEYMKKHDLTDSMVEDMAKPYENATFKSAATRGVVHAGSHIDAVGKKRVTVVYNAADTQKVAKLAKSKGVNPSEIYRLALANYLAAEA